MMRRIFTVAILAPIVALLLAMLSQTTVLADGPITVTLSIDDQSALDDFEIIVPDGCTSCGVVTNTTTYATAPASLYLTGHTDYLGAGVRYNLREMVGTVTTGTVSIWSQTKSVNFRGGINGYLYYTDGSYTALREDSGMTDNWESGWDNISIEDKTVDYIEWVNDAGNSSGALYAYLDDIKIVVAEYTPSGGGYADCTTITNSHFISGTTGWDATNVVTTAPSEALFEAGGQVAQTANPQNMVSNGSFEVDFSGWNITADCDLSDDAISGDKSAHCIADANNERIWGDIVVPNGVATLGFWLNVISGGVVVAIYDYGAYTNLSENEYTQLGWQWVELNRTVSGGGIRLWIKEANDNDEWLVDGVVLVDGTSIPVHATVHWIGRSDATHPVNATVSISSSTGIDSATHEFTGVKSEHHDELTGDFANGYSVIVDADEGFALDYLCLEFDEPPPGSSETVCYTVDDASFDTGSPWTLTSANVVSGSLELSAGGSASQPVLLDANSQYTVVMSTTFNSPSDLSITLGDYTDVLTIPVAASVSYEQVFTTGATITDSIISLASTAGDIDVHYICFEQEDRAYGVCLSLIPNGEFETDTYWLWRNGAMWNNIAGNAWLPLIEGSSWDSYDFSGALQYPLNGYFPEIISGEYLILQFDARSSEPGYVAAFLRDIGFAAPLTITFTAETDNQYTRYQVPVSLLSGHDGGTTQFGLFNVGATDGYSSTAGIFVDNVCLYLSDEEPQAPVISPTYGGYAGGLAFTCGTLSEYLYGITGIDFPALEAMEAPSLWDVDAWVPWLASRLWVNVGKPLGCLLIALFNNSSVLSVINWFDWAVRTIEQFPAWLAGWWNAVLLNVFLWFAWFQTGQHTWMEFVGLLVNWLWESLVNLGQYIAGAIGAQFTGLLNTLIGAWNTLLPALRGAVSSVMDLLVELWNMFAPVIGSIAGFFAMIIATFGLLGPAIFAIVGPLWSVFMTLGTLLFNNFHLTLSLPFNIYQAFDNSVNGEPFVLIPTCTDGGEYWCNFIFGTQLVNYTAGQSIFYPIVIVLIIVLTGWVISRHIWETLKPPDFR